MTDWRRSALVAALAALLAVPVASQAPPPAPPQSDQAQESVPTFRASVRYIEVDVDVKVRGQFLTDLTKDDFELFEDGKRQVIDRVTLVDIPAVIQTPGDQADAMRESKTAPVASLSVDGFNDSGRIYAMVLGIGPPAPSQRATWAGPAGPEGVKSLARKFVMEYLAPGDLLAIVHVDGNRGQGLTSDKDRLLNAIDRYGDVPPPAATRTDPYLFSSRYRQLPEHPDREDAFNRVYRTVKDVAVSLGSITGRRKSIILVSEGEDLWAEREDIHDRWAYVRDATRTAAAFNVPIHTLRPRGMVVPLLTDAEGASPLPMAFDNSGAEPGRRLLSEETNGVDIGTVNSADKGFRRVVAQNTRYYILGYYSSLGRDGRYHPITVRVKRNGADVSARRGVRTLRPIRLPDRVNLPRVLAATARDALLGKEVAATLPIDTSVEVFYGADFKAALLVQVAVDGSHLDLTPGGKLEFSVAAVDPQGVIRAFDRRAFTLNVRDDTLARLERDPVMFFSRLELPAGQYAIRVSAHQPGGVTGYESRDIQIPDFAERALNITNVLIASPSRSGLILQPDEIIRRGLRAPPTLERRFAPDETLTVFAEIYDSHWPLASEMTVTWAIARGETIAARGKDTIEVAQGGRGYFRGSIPLAKLAAGDYELQVEVRSGVGPPATARTSTSFQILSGE